MRFERQWWQSKFHAAAKSKMPRTLFASVALACLIMDFQNCSGHFQSSFQGVQTPVAPSNPVPVNGAGAQPASSQNCNTQACAGSTVPPGTATPTPAACIFNGQTIASGQSIPAYVYSYVPYGQTCQNTPVSCNNGTLVGSAQYSSCKVGPADFSCQQQTSGVSFGNGLLGREYSANIIATCTSATALPLTAVEDLIQQAQGVSLACLYASNQLDGGNPEWLCMDYVSPDLAARGADLHCLGSMAMNTGTYNGSYPVYTCASTIDNSSATLARAQTLLSNSFGGQIEMASVIVDGVVTSTQLFNIPTGQPFVCTTDYSTILSKFVVIDSPFTSRDGESLFFCYGTNSIEQFLVH